MNTLKNITKKAIAIGAAAFIAGATIASAAALDLSQYPAPFVNNGQFSGLIVVGEKAQAQDIIGAIDIAQSLQVASATPVSGGSGSSTVLSGDNVQIGDSSNQLEIGENIGTVTESLTESDLQLLKSGTITTRAGSADYTQTLNLDVENATTTGLVGLYKDKNADGQPIGTYLYFKENQPIFKYELEFTNGLESQVDSSNSAKDILDEELFMLGGYYSIVNAQVTNAGAHPAVALTLISGDSVDTMQQGDTKTYTLGGKKYEVTALAIGTAGSGDTTVKFLVNGQSTNTLGKGDTDTLADGTEIGVRDIIQTSAYYQGAQQSLVEFYLGANKLQITDNDIATDDGNADVKIDTKSISDLKADITGTWATSSDNVRINSISITLNANAASGSGIYMHPGEGLRSKLQDPSAMLANWDMVYQGLTAPKTSEISFQTSGDDQYDLRFVNRRGTQYDVPFAYANTAGNSTDGTFGDDSDQFVFWETDANSTGVADAVADYNIPLDSYFVVTGSDGVAATDNEDSYVLRFNDVNKNDNTVSFDDAGSGEQKTATFTGNLTADFTQPLTGANALATGNLNLGGKKFQYWVHDTTGNGDYVLAVVLDNNPAGLVNGANVDVVTQGGGILKLDAAGATSDATGGTFQSTLTTMAKDLDSNALQADNITFTENTDKYEVSIPSSAGADTQGTYLYAADSNANLIYAQNAYGTWFERTDRTSGSNDLTITYPSEQETAQVYVTGAGVTSTTVAGGSAGARINPISVGSAVLDSDVTYDQDNMIVVGGPCVNTIAAQLLGNPTDCTEGFTSGHAMLKLFDTGSHTALLVAGFEAQDTVGASRVLAQYGDYNLSGMSADVVVESLSNITVNGN